MSSILTRLKSKIRAFLLFTVGSRLRRFRTRRPVSRGDKILIHVGCGEFNDPRYINVDSRSGWHIDHIADIVSLPDIFGADYADMIYACHVVEHVSHRELPRILAGLASVLKPGGILRLSVPDFNVICKIYAELGSIDDILAPLMGGQGYAENFHCAVFDKEYLSGLLRAAGFASVRTWDPATADFHAFDDWAGRQYPAGGKQWAISLNLEAVK